MRKLFGIIAFLVAFQSCKKEDTEPSAAPTGLVIDPLSDRILEYPENISTDEAIPNFQFLNNDIGFYRNGADLFKTHDGGFTWKPYSNQITGLKELHALYFEDEYKWMAVARNEVVLRWDVILSEDGGQSFVKKLARKSTSGFNAESVFRKGDLYFMTNRGAVFYSLDAANNWEESG